MAQVPQACGPAPALDLGLVTDSEPAAAAGPPAQLDATALRRWSPAALLDLLFPPADAPRAGRVPRRAPRARVWIESNATEPKHWKLLKRQLDLRWVRLLHERRLAADDFPLFEAA